MADFANLLVATGRVCDWERLRVQVRPRLTLDEVLEKGTLLLDREKNIEWADEVYKIAMKMGAQPEILERLAGRYVKLQNFERAADLYGQMGREDVASLVRSIGSA